MPNKLIADVFKPLSLDIRAMNHAEYMLKGGRGSTKSSFISVMIVTGLIADENANAIIYRKVGNTIKDSVYEQIVWAINALGCGAWFTLKKSPLEIVSWRGQRIMFRGADDPMKSKSIKLSRGYFKYLWFEELSEFRGMEDIRTIKQSVLRGVDRAITLYSYNPPRSAQSWVNAEAMVDIEGRLVHGSSYIDVPREWLGDAFIAEAEALRTTNERAYRNEYLGEVTGTGGNVFDNLTVRRITDDEINGLHRFYNGCDFGFAVDPDAVMRLGYDPSSRRLYVVGEYYGARTPTDTLAEKIRAVCRDELIRCDSADPRMVHELRNRGINAVGAKKGAGSREHGYRWMCDLAEIIVDPARTPNAARELSAYEFERDRNGNFYANYPDGNDHSLDAMRYALSEVAAERRAGTVIW